MEDLIFWFRAACEPRLVSYDPKHKSSLLSNMQLCVHGLLHTSYNPCLFVIIKSNQTSISRTCTKRLFYYRIYLFLNVETVSFTNCILVIGSKICCFKRNVHLRLFYPFVYSFFQQEPNLYLGLLKMQL